MVGRRPTRLDADWLQRPVRELECRKGTVNYRIQARQGIGCARNGSARGTWAAGGRDVGRDEAVSVTVGAATCIQPRSSGRTCLRI